MPSFTCNGLTFYFELEDGGLRVESTDLAQVLGYAQPGSIRKQVLGDWKAFFKQGEDYVVETRPDELERWAARRSSDRGSLLPPLAKVSPRTGRLFLLAPGLERVLRWTSKAGAESLRLELAAFHPLFRGVDLEPGALETAVEPTLPPSTDGSAIKIEPKIFEPFAGSPPEPTETALTTADPLSLEERRFTHEVLQQLLRDFREFHARPDFCALALFSAEEALGRRLEGVPLLDAARARAPEKGAFDPTFIPRFEENNGKANDARLKTLRTAMDGFQRLGRRWITMSDIGRQTGHSSVAVGAAANAVAARFGKSAHDLRTQDTPHSRVRETRNGRGKQVLFSPRFAALIVCELGPRGTPRGAPSEFHVGGDSVPKLNRPFVLDAE